MRISLFLPVCLLACQHPLPEQPPAEVKATPTTAPTSLASASAPGEEPDPTTSPAPEEPSPSEELDAAFVEELLAIAAEYESYGRADDFFHWAPYLCALPMATRPGAHVSASTDDGTHGQKIYSLFAGLREETATPQPTIIAPSFQEKPGLYPISPGQKAYLGIAKGEPVPDGLALVKESWHPEEVTNPEEAARIRAERRVIERQYTSALPGEKKTIRPGSEFWPYAEKDGVLYHTKEKAGLFVMYKLPDETPGTDDGWVYGTVSADGKTVTSAGEVSSCMGCHTRAPYGRLFIDKKPGGK